MFYTELTGVWKPASIFTDCEDYCKKIINKVIKKFIGCKHSKVKVKLAEKKVNEMKEFRQVLERMFKAGVVEQLDKYSIDLKDCIGTCYDTTISVEHISRGYRPCHT